MNIDETIPATGLAYRAGRMDLATSITRAASKQTYYTFRFLAERSRVQDACRAYAYFRWVDDLLDSNSGTQQSKLAFIDRQSRLLEACYRKEPQPVACPEEQMLVDLIANDTEEFSGLQIYLRNMMAVMSFDVHRRGRVITRVELNQYSHLLSRAVTELLFYFLGRNDASPFNAERYQAVCGAHITHMLRDLLDDIDNGYINLPEEILDAQSISLDDLHSREFRMWVLERVRLAQHCFTVGRRYFSRVKDFRCRLAAYAYLARFEWVLKTIEHEGYNLRRSYPERKSWRAAVWMGWTVLRSALNLPVREDGDRPLA